MPMFLLLFLRLNIRAENNVFSTLYRYLSLFEFLRPNRHYCAITSSTYIKNTRMASAVGYLAQSFHAWPQAFVTIWHKPFICIST